MADAKISALTALTGANVDIAADVMGIVDTSVTTTKKITINELGIALGLFKIVNFTRDTSVASGTQAVTGVGFKPAAVIFIAGVSGGGIRASFGFDNLTAAQSIYSLGSAGNFNPDSSNSIGLVSVLNTDYVLGKISSLDSDGFTVTWTKTGSPTGSCVVIALALR